MPDGRSPYQSNSVNFYARKTSDIQKKLLDRKGLQNLDLNNQYVGLSIHARGNSTARDGTKFKEQAKKGDYYGPLYMNMKESKTTMASSVGLKDTKKHQNNLYAKKLGVWDALALVDQ